MTDEQIVRALECCGNMKECKKECPLGDVGGIDKCIHTLMLDALELIKRLLFELSEEKARGDMCADVIARQDKEIEKLEKAYLMYEETTGLKEARTEAIREFAERLNDVFGDGWLLGSAAKFRINNLVREMTEEK